MRQGYKTMSQELSITLQTIRLAIVRAEASHASVVHASQTLASMFGEVLTLADTPAHRELVKTIETLSRKIQEMDAMHGDSLNTISRLADDVQSQIQTNN